MQECIEELKNLNEKSYNRFGQPGQTRLVADADSGITTRGSHSHKVWIAAKG